MSFILDVKLIRKPHTHSHSFELVDFIIILFHFIVRIYFTRVAYFNVAQTETARIEQHTDWGRMKESEREVKSMPFIFETKIGYKILFEWLFQAAFNVFLTLNKTSDQKIDKREGETNTLENYGYFCCHSVKEAQSKAFLFGIVVNEVCLECMIRLCVRAQSPSIT